MSEEAKLVVVGGAFERTVSSGAAHPGQHIKNKALSPDLAQAQHSSNTFRTQGFDFLIASRALVERAPIYMQLLTEGIDLKNVWVVLEGGAPRTFPPFYASCSLELIRVVRVYTH